MKIFRDLDQLPDFENTVITIGSFDGVHLGHQKIIERINQISKDINGESVVITFHPHPRAVIYPKDDSLKLLSSLDEKIRLLEFYGVDNLVIAPFSVEFSQMHAREYVENFLVKNFNPKEIVIGYDHKFGLNRQGDINLLKEYADKGLFRISEISKKEIDEITISSTKIRNALIDGQLAQANSLLNHHYTIEGIVGYGKQIGRELGYPTANIEISEKYKLIPHFGIYAVLVYLEEECYQGMLYIGQRPSIKDDSYVSVEVNILDFNDEIYKQKIKVELIKYIRDDMQFDDMAGLTNQISIDEKTVRSFFESYEVAIEKPNVAVAILNFNGQALLESYLPSIGHSQKKSFNTYVIDNASTDNSISFCEEWFPEVELIKLNQNHGFAEGYNRGLKQIDHKYVVLINSDVMVEENWLDPIVDLMEKDSSIGACMPKIMSLEEPEKFEYAGASGGMMDALGYPFCRGRIFDSIEEDMGQYDDIQDVFWTSGAAMVVRNELFKNLGGFDKDYFAHMEEIDLCWRMKRAGYKLKVVPTVKVFHLGGGTLNYDSPRKVKLNFRNNLATLLKNENGIRLIWLFPLRLMLDGVAGIRFLVQCQPSACLAIIKSHLSIYFNFFKWMRKRKAYSKLINENSIAFPDYSGKIGKSILVEYFLRKKTKFSEILT